MSRVMMEVTDFTISDDDPSYDGITLYVYVKHSNGEVGHLHEMDFNEPEDGEDWVEQANEMFKALMLVHNVDFADVRVNSGLFVGKPNTHREYNEDD